jgi:adenylate cyclase
MERILRDPELLKLGGQRREVTILFSDIRSFTALTEKLPPQQLTRLLNEYFEAMTEEVFATEGVVDKFVGDAIMAFWGAPVDSTGSGGPGGEDCDEYGKPPEAAARQMAF